MLLAIDIGNTNTVFALCEGEQIVKTWRSETGAADQYKELESNTVGIDDVIVSSVVPNTNEALSSFCQRQIGKAPIFVDAAMTGLTIDLDNPDEAGADRLVNARAVVDYYSAPAIVIDFGTATTFDVIDAQGRYSGGVIAPGVNLSIEALHRATAKLPSVPVEKPPAVIGKNTVHAIQSGIYWGYIGLIEGIVQKIIDDMGVKPLVLATGGLAPLFADSTPLIDKVDEELTLKGLTRIYQARQMTTTVMSSPRPAKRA